MVGSIRCISWWWKVVLMWCLQSSTGEMDIWSSIWPNLTPGLLPDLISLLLGVEVESIWAVFFFSFFWATSMVISGYCWGVFVPHKLTMLLSHRDHCNAMSWKITSRLSQVNNESIFSGRFWVSLVLVCSQAIHTIYCMLLIWSQGANHKIRHLIFYIPSLSCCSLIFLFFNRSNISPVTHIQGQR